MLLLLLALFVTLFIAIGLLSVRKPIAEDAATPVIPERKQRPGE